MRRKGLLVISILLIVLFVFSSWFGVASVMRKLDATLMRAGFEAAEKSKHCGNWEVANRNYRGAIASWQRVLQSVGYYPDLGGEYLVAGNCLQCLLKVRSALECYEKGLLSDPNSISLLSSMGDCTYRLGEYEKAYFLLSKSRSLYPLKTDIRPLWKNLRLANE